MSFISQYIRKQFGDPKGFGGKVSTTFMNIFNRRQYKSILENMGNSYADEKILDIGFGNGYLLKKLANQSPAKFYGVEISFDMLKQVLHKNKKNIALGKIILQSGCAEKLPFQNEMFDKVYTVNTIYFWEDLDKGYSEIYRVLKREGTFINVVYTKKYLDKLVYTNYGFKKYEIEELKEKALENGFRNIVISELKPNVSFSIMLRK